MGMSRTLGTYTDIARVLDTALANGGASFRLPTGGKARHWVQRAYFYRKLLHDQQAARLGNVVETRNTATPYDQMKLTLDGPIVIIEFDLIEGVLLDGEGNPLDLPEITSGWPGTPTPDLTDEDQSLLEEVITDLKLEIEE